MIAWLRGLRKGNVQERTQSNPSRVSRDPRVNASKEASRAVLERNAVLVRELAALERELARRRQT